MLPGAGVGVENGIGLCSKAFVSTTPFGVTNVIWYMPGLSANGMEGSSGKVMMNCTVSSTSQISLDVPESEEDSNDHDRPLFIENGIYEPHLLSMRSRNTSMPFIGSMSEDPIFRAQTRIDVPWALADTEAIIIFVRIWSPWELWIFAVI